MKNNGLRRLLALLVFAALGFSLGLPQAMSQEDTVLKVQAFAKKGEELKLTRPIAKFDHDAHMEVMDSECASCHHGKTEDGKQDFDNYDTDESCADCHTLEGGNGVTPLKRAYHQQCIGCHTTMGAGPTYCAGCHTN